MNPSFDREAFEREGYSVLEGVFDPEEVREMIRSAEASPVEGAGSRNALAWPWVQVVADDRRIRAIVGADAVAVRGILFDKTPSANWNLGYHQDRAVALRERLDVDGFTGWSNKDGVPHAIAPAEVLERMTAVRISLDDCGSENGPLRVLPGTHNEGVVNASRVAELGAARREVLCTNDAGGIVVMKSLLLHASSASKSPAHRRVLHLEFFHGDLPGGLNFYPWKVAGM